MTMIMFHNHKERRNSPPNIRKMRIEILFPTKSIKSSASYRSLPSLDISRKNYSNACRILILTLSNASIFIKACSRTNLAIMPTRKA